jgi:predicted transcriptional regulator
MIESHQQDKIACAVCGYEAHYLVKHLEKHALSQQEYEDRYGVSCLSASLQ